MLGQHFDGGDVLMLGKNIHFLGRRDVEHVHAAAVLACEGQQTLGAAHGGFHVAPFRMHRDIGAVLHQRGAFGEAHVIFAVHRDAAGAGGENATDVFVVGHQQGAGAGPHEHFDAAHAWQTLEHAKLFGVVRRCADVKGEIGPGAARGAADLVVDGRFVGGGRIGVGHFEQAGNTAENSATGARFKIFLMDRTGFAEMDLFVDDAGHHGETLCLEARSGRGGAKIADGDGAAGAHAHIGLDWAAGKQKSSAREDEVESLFHRSTPLAEGHLA